MRTMLAIAVILALGCGGKKDSGGSSGSAGSAGSGSGSSVAAGSGSADKISCPPGNAVSEGKCAPVVTPDKVAAVTKQQSRIDDLAKLLDQVDTASAPIELFDAIRKLDAWKAAAVADSRLAKVDETVGQLAEAVKKLRTFKASLGQVSAQLGDLRGELDRLLKDTSSPKLADVRAQITGKVRTMLEPFGGDVADTIRSALAPLISQLGEYSDYVTVACVAAKTTKASDSTMQLCESAKTAFAKATVYLKDLEGRPAEVFGGLVKELESQLDLLVDAEAKKALDAVQAKVNDALRLPGGSGSSVGSGSGSAK